MLSLPLHHRAAPLAQRHAEGLQERPLLLVPVACILAISLWTLLAPWGCHDSVKVGAGLSRSIWLLHRVILRAPHEQLLPSVAIANVLTCSLCHTKPRL